MFPIDNSHISEALRKLGMPDVASATIRQIVALASELEPVAGEPFVRLELGNPGIPAEAVGIQAQCEALRTGVANMYPNMAGIPELKKAATEFVKAFFDVNIGPKYVIPTVGSMQASFTLQLLLAQRIKGKDTMLFINPGFPAQRHQAKVLGIPQESFDIYNYRGKALEVKLEEVLSKDNITGLLYSNPNNPAWINLTEEELEIIGRLATKYDVIVIEDLAYLGMDFRTDFSRPYQPPYIPTVARYTDNYIMLVSGSKIFSYAGERIATVCMCPATYERTYQALADFYDMPALGDAYIFGVLYTASSGASHSAQHALASMMKAAVEGRLPMVEHTREYARRARRAKQAFTDNGFHIVYEKDGEADISDGFFFTVGYPGISGEQLQKELLRYGISSIHLHSTGSEQEGVRVTVSMLKDDKLFDMLNERLHLFHEQH